MIGVKPMADNSEERLRDLIAQVADNQKHERHATYKETAYWCAQWRLLAERFAESLIEHQKGGR